MTQLQQDIKKAIEDALIGMGSVATDSRPEARENSFMVRCESRLYYSPELNANGVIDLDQIKSEIKEEAAYLLYHMAETILRGKVSAELTQGGLKIRALEGAFRHIKWCALHGDAIDLTPLREKLDKLFPSASVSDAQRS